MSEQRDSTHESEDFDDGHNRWQDYSCVTSWEYLVADIENVLRGWTTRALTSDRFLLKELDYEGVNIAVTLCQNAEGGLPAFRPHDGTLDGVDSPSFARWLGVSGWVSITAFDHGNMPGFRPRAADQGDEPAPAPGSSSRKRPEPPPIQQLAGALVLALANLEVPLPAIALAQGDALGRIEDGDAASVVGYILPGWAGSEGAANGSRGSHINLASEMTSSPPRALLRLSGLLRLFLAKVRGARGAVPDLSTGIIATACYKWQWEPSLPLLSFGDPSAQLEWRRCFERAHSHTRRRPRDVALRRILASIKGDSAVMPWGPRDRGDPLKSVSLEVRWLPVLADAALVNAAAYARVGVAATAAPAAAATAAATAAPATAAVGELEQGDGDEVGKEARDLDAAVKESSGDAGDSAPFVFDPCREDPKCMWRLHVEWQEFLACDSLATLARTLLASFVQAQAIGVVLMGELCAASNGPIGPEMQQRALHIGSVLGPAGQEAIRAMQAAAAVANMPSPGELAAIVERLMGGEDAEGDVFGMEGWTAGGDGGIAAAAGDGGADCTGGGGGGDRDRSGGSDSRASVDDADGDGCSGACGSERSPWLWVPQDGAPVGRLLSLLSLEMARLPSPSLLSFASLWVGVVQELRVRWEAGEYIPRMAPLPAVDGTSMFDDHCTRQSEGVACSLRRSVRHHGSRHVVAGAPPLPDMRLCILHQKLQLINCCVAELQDDATLSNSNARRARTGAVNGEATPVTVADAAAAHTEPTDPPVLAAPSPAGREDDGASLASAQEDGADGDSDDTIISSLAAEAAAADAARDGTDEEATFGPVLVLRHPGYEKFSKEEEGKAMSEGGVGHGDVPPPRDLESISVANRAAFFERDAVMARIAGKAPKVMDIQSAAQDSSAAAGKTAEELLLPPPPPSSQSPSSLSPRLPTPSPPLLPSPPSAVQRLLEAPSTPDFAFPAEADGVPTLLLSGRPVVSPRLQPAPPLTCDMLEQQASLLQRVRATAAALESAATVRSSDGGGSCTAAANAVAQSWALRKQVELAPLLSDMVAFRAANLAAVFADFARWYSPANWTPEHDGVAASNAEAVVSNGVACLQLVWPGRGTVAWGGAGIDARAGEDWMRVWADVSARGAATDRVLSGPTGADAGPAVVAAAAAAAAAADDAVVADGGDAAAAAAAAAADAAFAEVANGEDNAAAAAAAIADAATAAAAAPPDGSKPLFSASQEGEKTLHFLETIAPSPLLAQMLIAFLALAEFLLAEAETDATRLAAVKAALETLRTCVSEATQELAAEASSSVVVMDKRIEHAVSQSALVACDRACDALASAESLLCQGTALLHKFPGQLRLVDGLLRSESLVEALPGPERTAIRALLTSSGPPYWRGGGWDASAGGSEAGGDDGGGSDAGAAAAAGNGAGENEMVAGADATIIGATWQTVLAAEYEEMPPALTREYVLRMAAVDENPSRMFAWTDERRLRLALATTGAP